MDSSWKKVSIKKIAEIANVGSATVDRVLHNRAGVKKSTKIKIINALEFLEQNNLKKKIFFYFVNQVTPTIITLKKL